MSSGHNVPMAPPTPIPLGFVGAGVTLVADGKYHEVVRRLARGSRRRFLANVFIVDPTPGRDPELNVDSLLSDLGFAARRGVDVRLLIGGSRSNMEIAEATVMAYWRARQHGIPTRLIAFKRDQSSHVKIVISDSSILTGSHNWSGGAFSNAQTQDSVLIDSADAAVFFASHFAREWKVAARKGDNV